ncbi:MAG: sugar phosphate isomerase/epimerase [Planctomycetota bacterium]|jgi:sugar phosphate isomerase/epimerase|nr:sugar phosphate isomerase/epimerase [Planctomycetota bacterium]
MELGFCSNMLAWPGDTTGLSCLEQIRDAGFDYVEAPAAQLLALQPDELKAMEKRILSSGLPCRAFNNLFQPGIRLTGGSVDNRKVDEYCDRAIALAVRLGVEIMVFGSAAARNVPFGFPLENAWEQLTGLLGRMGPKLEKHGVTLVIEHLNRLEGNIGDSFGAGLRLAEASGHPNIKGFVDFYHLDLGNENIAAVEENFSRIRHCHFSNVLNRSIPTPFRHEPRLTGFLDMLKRLNYSHRLSVEGFPAGGDVSLLIPAAAEYVRSRID